MSLTTQYVKASDGTEVAFEIGPAANIDSFFVFSMHKTGSTLLNQMLADVCQIANVPLFCPEMIEFRNGLPLGDLDLSVQSRFRQRGYCFSGFRTFPKYLEDFDLKQMRKIFLIRDPRDMVVSRYFSAKISHPIAKGELGEKMKKLREQVASKGVDEYSLWYSKVISFQFTDYARNIFDSNVKIFRYEDVIFEKRKWLTDTLDYAGIDILESQIHEIADKYDIVPDVEDETKHIRRVTPGDHKIKLKPETIEQLNNTFADMLRRFNYNPTDA